MTDTICTTLWRLEWLSLLALRQLKPLRISVETEGKVTTGMTLLFRHPTRDLAKRDVPPCDGVPRSRWRALPPIFSGAVEAMTLTTV